jgi:phosphatidylserine/phosphatidylglycerophosphate/cardiolipin synthase-like enzyme
MFMLTSCCSIAGQSNVGHIVRDEGVATKYADYWEHLSRDPPGRKHPSKARGVNGIDAPMDEVNERIHPDMRGQITSSPSITVIFSPRKSIEMLQWYADRMEEAKLSVHYTAAFGVAQPIAEVLNRGHVFHSEGLRRSPRLRPDEEKNTTGKSLLRYILLDSRPSKKSSDKAKHAAEKKGSDHLDYNDITDIKENRCAFGAVLHASDECLTGLTTFVDYIHTKYMILDAISDNPSVFTGSANFSAASTEKNDENMILIQGDTGVADVYVTEFMRLFDHFYSRDKHNDNVGQISSEEQGHEWGEVVTDETWLEPYFEPSSQLYKERLLLR